MISIQNPISPLLPIFPMKSILKVRPLGDIHFYFYLLSESLFTNMLLYKYSYQNVFHQLFQYLHVCERFPFIAYHSSYVPIHVLPYGNM
mgnify:CR=1 FL=1